MVRELNPARFATSPARKPFAAMIAPSLVSVVTSLPLPGMFTLAGAPIAGYCSDQNQSGLHRKEGT